MFSLENMQICVKMVIFASLLNHQNLPVMNLLIVGATGQLGYTIAEKLRQSSHSVFALYRDSSNTKPLEELGFVKFRKGDLRDPASIASALQDIEVVICTANTAIPTQKNDHFHNVDKTGVQHLIDEAKKQAVKHFIYVSVLPFQKWDSLVPLSRAKRYIEKHLQHAGIPFTIFQPTAFMDVHFAFFGTELPLAGAKVSTVKRPFGFANQFFDGIKSYIPEKGLFNLVGSGKQRIQYISIDTTAEFCVHAIGKPEAMQRIIPIGGPEAISPLEVKAIFEEAYQKPLTVKSAPPAVMRIMSLVHSPFNINAANILAMNYAGAMHDSLVPDAQRTAGEFGVKLQSAREFIQEKMNA